MKRSLYSRTLGVGILVLIAAVVLPLSFHSSLKAQSAAADKGCTNGKLSASLTGWMMNDEMPNGTAGFDADKNQLTVSVESVKLPDGTKLEVLIGDKKIGELDSLTKGEAKGQITLDKDLSEGSRVRVLNDKRPVVSGNMVCHANETGKTSD